MQSLKRIIISLICMFIFTISYNYNQNDVKYPKEISSNYKLDNKYLEIDTTPNIDYMYGWDNPRVNCYKGVEIPNTAKIDVSGFTLPINGKVTSEYGYRSQFGRMHYGIDLDLNIGDTIRAAFEGIVRIVNCDTFGYGKYIVLRHNNGVETVYAHLSKYLVNREQKIQSGQPIGLGGNTGRGTNPHLHFEIRYLGLALNPSNIVDFESGKTWNKIYAFDKKNYKRKNKTNKKERVNPSLFC